MMGVPPGRPVPATPSERASSRLSLTGLDR